MIGVNHALDIAALNFAKDARLDTAPPFLRLKARL